MTQIAVIHLVRAVNGDLPLQRFIESYRQHPAGTPHDLVVIFKGYSDPIQLAAHKSLLQGIRHEAIEVPDDGFDIGSYQRAVQSLDHDLLCFLNSYSRILADDWLQKLTNPFGRGPVGLVGATGSWESMYSDVRYAAPPGWLRRIKWLVGLAVRRIQFPSFPNPHIRSNAFVIRREVFLKLNLPAIRSKENAWQIESGRNSITRQVLARGLDAVVVGMDNKVYAIPGWRESRTFRRDSQSNLLIADNQTDLFETQNGSALVNGSAKNRGLEDLAWTNPVLHRTRFLFSKWDLARIRLFGRAAAQIEVQPSSDLVPKEPSLDRSRSGPQAPIWRSLGPDVGMFLTIPLHISGWVKISFTLIESSSIPPVVYIEVIPTGEHYFAYRSGSSRTAGRFSAHVRLLDAHAALLRVRSDVGEFGLTEISCTRTGRWRIGISTMLRHPTLFRIGTGVVLRCAMAIARGDSEAAGGMFGTMKHDIGLLKNVAGPGDSYDAYISQYESKHVPALRQPGAGADEESGPLFSLLINLRDGQKPHAAATLDSIRGQNFGSWEALVVDCRTTDALFPRNDDPRIVMVKASGPDRCGANSNDMIARSRGRYIAWVDAGDRLSRSALLEVAQVLEHAPPTDVVYTDEDWITRGGARSAPFFKPDWSPEYAETVFYTGKLACYRRESILALGGVGEAYQEAAQYDLILKLSERNASILHIPRVLYHRFNAGAVPIDVETALPPDHLPNSQRFADALRDHLKRSGRLQHVMESSDNPQVRGTLRAAPRISIVIPTAGLVTQMGARRIDLLPNCIESLLGGTTRANLEIVIAHNGDLRPEVVSALSRRNAKLYKYTPAGRFNLAEKINFGVRHAEGKLVLILNDDIEMIEPGSIEEMAAWLDKPEVGAVGADLVYPDGSIQHAGVVFVDAVPYHVYRGRPAVPGYYGVLTAARNCSAVTGACIMVRRQQFLDVGGFDEEFPFDFNDVDFCLKLRSRGLRIVQTPKAKFVHFESRSRMPSGDVQERLHKLIRRWYEYIYIDPYYSRYFLIDPPYTMTT